ncbi:hypothetical protein [Moorena producens]|uniref:hypothetical protein n=1 Tax=Moorena producens TaxID=1155739 RepID=UPI0011EA6987|nr:hypothetical protein [Moorena producens]
MRSHLAAPKEHRNGRSRFQLQQPIAGFLSKTVCRLINTIRYSLLRTISSLLTITACYTKLI